MKGWLAILALVAGYDAWAGWTSNQSLSGHYLAAKRKHPFAVGGFTMYIVTHLWGHWPAQADPFGHCSRLFIRFVVRHPDAQAASFSVEIGNEKPA